MKIKNEKPQTFYGLHMVKGLAEYADMGMLLIENEACLKMNKSFQGCPVYVEHVDDVDYSTIEGFDGIVNESFYNEKDGNHWAKFQVFTQEAKDKIAEGWRLSNSYKVTAKSSGGTYHGASYAEEVIDGEYDHLAIVKDPRYEESIILTPEEFKQYNEEKERELKKLANSKDKPLKEKKGMLNIFKKEKVENSADIENSVIETRRGDLTIAELVKIVNEKEDEDKKPMNEDSMIKVGEEEMKLSELKNKYMQMCEEKKNKKKNEEDEEEEKKNKKKNEEGEEEDKKKNSSDKSDFDKIQNAGDEDSFEEEVSIMTNEDMISLGRERY